MKQPSVSSVIEKNQPLRDLHVLCRTCRWQHQQYERIIGETDGQMSLQRALSIQAQPVALCIKGRVDTILLHNDCV